MCGAGTVGTTPLGFRSTFVSSAKGSLKVVSITWSSFDRASRRLAESIGHYQLIRVFSTPGGTKA